MRIMKSLPARGAWIEIMMVIFFGSFFESLPARGAWIEIQPWYSSVIKSQVAPRKGSVD